jgi:diguanylate cyclase (GGDEF)-like protein/putative nucleotidyltransferase with HDIG domain
MGDVNGLKLTNAVFGHAFGDLLLQKVSDAFLKACRPGDVIARWGGDEFIVLLAKTSRAEAEKIVTDIKARFAAEHVRAIKGSISMGFDTKERVQDSLLSVLESAEDGMYSQKTLEKSEVRGGMIKTIVNALYAAQPREESHAKNVGAIALSLGKRLHFSEGELRKLKDAALLHDIGKITVADYLFYKKEQLTPQEWTEVKQHPVVGYRILNSFDETMDLAPFILYHHERWDGSGYPKGLKGKEIPKIARVISLAESYDEMVAGGPYKHPMTKEEAACELQSNAGTQFDRI